jgi:hypothetical protein
MNWPFPWQVPELAFKALIIQLNLSTSGCGTPIALSGQKSKKTPNINLSI